MLFLFSYLTDLQGIPSVMSTVISAYYTLASVSIVMVDTCPVLSGTLPVLWHFYFFSKGACVRINVTSNASVK